MCLQSAVVPAAVYKVEGVNARPENRCQLWDPDRILHMATDRCCALDFRSAFLVHDAAENAAASCRTIQLTTSAM